jgi:hypothetical protein
MEGRLTVSPFAPCTGERETEHEDILTDSFWGMARGSPIKETIVQADRRDQTTSSLILKSGETPLIIKRRTPNLPMPLPLAQAAAA